jgi:hypothetical protein
MIKQVTRDIDVIKSLLPDHYQVTESKEQPGSIRCKSSIGLVKKGTKDKEDKERWDVIATSAKEFLQPRFKEIKHSVNALHKDFTVVLEQDDEE